MKVLMLRNDPDDQNMKTNKTCFLSSGTSAVAINNLKECR